MCYILERPTPTMRKIVKALHFTDVHTDLEYKEGTNT